MSDLIEAFFRSFETTYSPLCAVHTPATPREMIVGESTDSPGWVRWRPVPCSSPMEQEWRELEVQAGISLPSFFKRWYGSYYTLSVDVSIARLPEHWPNRPLAPVREALLSALDCFTRPRTLGLVPFGGDEAFMDAGPLCFDARGGGSSESWPVVFWDHEWVGHSKEIGGPIFSSFEKLLECCTHYMDRASDVRSRMSGQADECRRETGRILPEFFEIDPSGAGNTGRDYWLDFMEGLQF